MPPRCFAKHLSGRFDCTLTRETYITDFLVQVWLVLRWQPSVSVTLRRGNKNAINVQLIVRIVFIDVLVCEYCVNMKRKAPRWTRAQWSESQRRVKRWGKSILFQMSAGNTLSKLQVNTLPFGLNSVLLTIPLRAATESCQHRFTYSFDLLCACRVTPIGGQCSKEQALVLTQGVWTLDFDTMICIVLCVCLIIAFFFTTYCR